MGSKHDIENLTASTYSEPLKTPRTKLEVIPPNDVDGDTFYVTTNRNKYFLNGLLKFYRGILMDPFFNFLERADKELSENIYFYLPLVYSLSAVAICFETCCDTSKVPVTWSLNFCKSYLRNTLLLEVRYR